jgi:hypothetical protein
MIVHVRVLLALRATHLTGSDTGLKLIPPQALVNGRLPSYQAPRSCTDVGTIQVEPDTSGQLLNMRFAQAGIGTGCTRLGTIKTGFNTCSERLHLALLLTRMCS